MESNKMSAKAIKKYKDRTKRKRLSENLPSFEEMAIIQKETGISYGKQMARNYWEGLRGKSNGSKET